MTSQGKVVLGGITVVFIIITIIKATIPAPTTYNFFIRLFALWGFTSMAIATIMTPFLREVTKNFGKPFLKVHHLFAFSGTALITLHPIVLAIERLSLTVFLPNFESWYLFWLLAGRPSLIILYIALLGILFRKKIKAWRAIHALMYPMLLMGYVHGVMIGTDFQNVGILIIFTILFALAMVAFVLKRYQVYKLQKAKKK